MRYLLIALLFVGCSVANESPKTVFEDVIDGSTSYTLHGSHDSLKVNITSIGEKTGSFTIQWNVDKNLYVKKDNINNLPFVMSRQVLNRSHLKIDTDSKIYLEIVSF